MNAVKNMLAMLSFIMSPYYTVSAEGVVEPISFETHFTKILQVMLWGDELLIGKIRAEIEYTTFAQLMTGDFSFSIKPNPDRDNEPYLVIDFSKVTGKMSALLLEYNRSARLAQQLSEEDIEFYKFPSISIQQDQNAKCGGRQYVNSLYHEKLISHTLNEDVKYWHLSVDANLTNRYFFSVITYFFSLIIL